MSDLRDRVIAAAAEGRETMVLSKDEIAYLHDWFTTFTTSGVLRKEPQIRKQEILDAAVLISQSGSYLTFTRSEVAAVVGCSDSLIPHYYPIMGNLRHDVLEHAFDNKIEKIMLQAIANNDKFLNGVSDAFIKDIVHNYTTS